jgi:hypothetical protein
MTDIGGLLERVRDNDEADNALDVEIEIATFQPDALYASIRANAAGTKLIYTMQDGQKHTCWAWDWTLNTANRNQATALLSALSSGDAS